MLIDILIRVVVGGVVVSLFAILGGSLKPQTFAGLFAAAPSVALATILLTVSKEGRAYAATEAHAMVFGAIAFLAYSCVCTRLLFSGRWSALGATISALPIWGAVAFGLWAVFLRSQ